ncbi:F-box protein [Parachlamydia sp. AcF125]|uniref:F-box protein n=1 Tax=Parachlamydia sp. AcF125 TaxID=2795736 RepID=UPI001BC9A0F8|nr:F-box protein [Parachlamydia sp. AcF125]MBS4168290.1 hypothetical protein [Parachlamydia sp. AcF125]
MTISLNTFFSSLPNEVKAECLKPLEPKNLAIAALVSRSWKELVENPSVWKGLFHRHWKKISYSEKTKFGNNWKSIFKKRYEISKKVQHNKRELLKDAYTHTTYKLPEFVPTETYDLKVGKKFVFAKITQGSAQIYHLGKNTVQLAFNNKDDETSLLVHCYDEHIMQLTREGHLYRWNVMEKRASQPIACLKDFDEAYFDQNFLLLILPQRKKFRIVNVETGATCYESLSLSSSIQTLIYRNNQAFIQCLDGSFYFFNHDLEDGLSQSPPFTKLEGDISFSLADHLVRFDKKRVIALSEDGVRRDCKVWSASTGKIIFAGQLQPIYLDKVFGSERKIITASEYNGELLAIGFNSGCIILYNPDTGLGAVENNCAESAVRLLFLEKEHFVAVPEVFGTLTLVNTSVQSKTFGSVYPNRPENFPDFAFNLAGAYYDERKIAICTKDGWLDIWDFAKKTSPHLIT